MLDICCCLKKNLYKKINNNDDTKLIYNNLKKYFLNRDYIAISNEDLYDISTIKSKNYQKVYFVTDKNFFELLRSKSDFMTTIESVIKRRGILKIDVKKM